MKEQLKNSQLNDTAKVQEVIDTELKMPKLKLKTKI